MSSPFYQLTGGRIVYYEEPGRTVADAETRALQAATPLDVTATAFPPEGVPALGAPALVGLAGLLAGLGLRTARRWSLGRRDAPEWRAAP
jgi:hypothetical protein